MKYLFILIAISFFDNTYARIGYFGVDDSTRQKIDAAYAFIKEQGIRLNSVTPLPGFKAYYDCDSSLFLKGVFGDTIKILTHGMEMPQELSLFRETVREANFGQSVYAEEVQDDGRVLVIYKSETDFIFRNDSLFEIGNSAPLPFDVSSSPLSAFFKGEIDQATYERKEDSLHQVAEKQAVYLPKLIFTKSMFRNGVKKVRLPRKVNFDGDTIILETQWIDNGKHCYVVRINNQFEGEPTSYAYAIDEDLKFVWWEGCNPRYKK